MGCEPLRRLCPPGGSARRMRSISQALIANSRDVIPKTDAIILRLKRRFCNKSFRALLCRTAIINELRTANEPRTNDRHHDSDTTELALKLIPSV